VQTRRLAASFETFTGSVEHTRPEKFPCKSTCVLAFFFKNPRKQPDAKVLITKIKAPNHYGGAKVLVSIQNICFQKTSGSNMAAPNLLPVPGTI